MIQIYGSPRTSAGRCYLMLEEVGVPYEAKALDMFEKREHKSPDYLKLNPNGKVPVLVDGDFVLWESIAINSYLAERYKPELLGHGAQEAAHVQQWSLWGLVELQPPLVDLIIQTMFVPEPTRDAKLIEKARVSVPPMLKVLDDHLNGKTQLVANRLTVADFNVASVANIAYAMKIDLSGYPHLTAWMGALKQRPSFKKFVELRSH